MILGIDLGNVETKTSKLIHFMSKISYNVAFENNFLLEYEGLQMLIGDGNFETDLNKVDKQNILPLLYAAIYRSTLDTSNKIVLGLPVAQVKEKKDELKELIMRNNRKNINGRVINITDVEVVGEGLATIYNLSKEDKEKLGHKPLLIIDIGGRTIDITFIKWLDGKWTVVKYKTIPLGILNLYDDIIKTVNEEYISNFELEDAEMIIEEGLFLYGKYQDTSFLKPIIKFYFDSIMKDINLGFNIDSGYIYLTGGGSKIFKQAFMKRMPNLLVSENPFFDNALSYEKVGIQLWQRK